MKILKSMVPENVAEINDIAFEDDNFEEVTMENELEAKPDEKKLTENEKELIWQQFHNLQNVKHGINTYQDECVVEWNLDKSSPAKASVCFEENRIQPHINTTMVYVAEQTEYL